MQPFEQQFAQVLQQARLNPNNTSMAKLCASMEAYVRQLSVELERVRGEIARLKATAPPSANAP